MKGRLHRTWWGIRQETHWGRTALEAGRRQWLFDVILYRALAWPRIQGYYGPREEKKVRTLRTSSGITVHYRPNRGDIQGIREIFIDEIYRLPEGVEVTGLVDLGANIGLATIWLAKTYNLEGVIAVEPLPENTRLLRTNARANGVPCQVIEAAVGLEHGVTYFAVTESSNMGHVADTGREIPLVALLEIINDVTFAQPLLKMDIEGMEGPLLQQLDAAWVKTFSAIVMEMHPEVVDVGELVHVISSQGFSYRESYERTTGYTREKRERLFLRN